VKYIDLRERTKEDILKIVMEKNIEIERLNNIINGLEKELELNLPFKVVGVRRLLNKLQKLKDSDKE